MDEEYQYTEAFSELQEIVSEIERGDISIDELSHKVKRAALLIAVCKAKLTATEADVSAILETLKQTESEEASEPTDEDDGADNGVSEEENGDSPDEDPEKEEE